jgi:hypothetical protein
MDSIEQFLANYPQSQCLRTQLPDHMLVGEGKWLRHIKIRTLERPLILPSKP